MTLTAEKFVTTGIGWTPISHAKSTQCYRQDLETFELFLNRRNKTGADENITNEDIDDYVAHLKNEKGYKSSTIYRKINVVSSYSKWLHKNRIIATPRNIKSQPRGSIVYKKIPQEVLDKIFQYSNSPANQNDLFKIRDAAMISLVMCGVKTGTIESLNVENVSFETAKISTPKKTVSFAPFYRQFQNYETLKKISGIIQQPYDPFFLNKFKERISSRSFRRRLTKLLKTLNLSEYVIGDLHFTAKCLRRSKTQFSTKKELV